MELPRARGITLSGERGQSIHGGDSITECVVAGRSTVHRANRGLLPGASWRLSREGLGCKKRRGRDFGPAAMGLGHQVKFSKGKVT